MGSTQCNYHVATPERQHVRLHRETEAAKDSTTPLRMTYVSTNTDRWKTWFPLSGPDPYKIAN